MAEGHAEEMGWFQIFCYVVGAGVAGVLALGLVYLSEVASCAFIYKYQCHELAPR